MNGDGSFSYSTGTNEYNFANWLQDVYQVNGGRHYNGFTQANEPITHVGADDFWNPDIDGFFDYHLMPGPATQRNAIRLLDRIGFPAKVVARAMKLTDV